MPNTSTKPLVPNRILVLSSVVILCIAAMFTINRCEQKSRLPDTGKATPVPAIQRWTNSIGMSFVVIPAGSFTMGSASSASESHEQPPHPVTISRPFSMAVTELTQAQWKIVMGSDPSKFEGDNLPVEQVGWDDAMEFIRKLNSMEGTTRYRLPTEAEWEYACRAGKMQDRDDGLGSVAWYDPNSGGTTHPVGQKEANAWGLYDMLGNVYEWCEDWKGAYASGHVTDPRGPSSGQGRVVRGGSWYVHANRTLPFFRDFLTPGERRSDVGLRVVAVAPTP